MPRRVKESQGIKTRDVNAGARAAAALRLALEGHPWKTIAALSGYASEGAAYNAVQRELQRAIRPAAEQLIEMERQRLDQLLTVYYPKAMSGDGWSFDRVLRLMERRAALLGLDARPDQSQQQAQMIVIGVPQAVLEAV